MASVEEFNVPNLTWLSGNPVTITSSGVYAFQFFATWCPPCMRSIPGLSELARENPNVTFVGVSGEARNALRSHPTADYPIACAGDNSTSRTAYMALQSKLGIRGIPHIVLISDGQIVFQGHPMDPQFAEKVRELNQRAEQAKQREAESKLTPDEVRGLSVRELQVILRRRGVDTTGLLEKQEYVNKVIEVLGLSESGDK